MINFKRRKIPKFVAIDSQFPQKEPFGFRNIEINEYLSRISGFETYAMSPMEPWGNAWFPWSYGTDEKTFQKNMNGYLKTYPQNKKRIKYLNSTKKYDFDLAYSYFLAETYVLLPFYEKNRIPFIFILYPGGTFGLNNEKSDGMLKDICSSKYFKGVITTQALTTEYLIKNKFCDENKIHYIFGGFSQIRKEDVLPKQHYKKEKKTFDICFVSGKYTEKGIDKGYDIFVDTARKLYRKNSDIRFHVVGSFGENEIELNEVSEVFTFYGYKDSEFLTKFYSKIDIFLSPNRKGKLYEGNFDGFPLAIDAPFCGVAFFGSDELDLNRGQLVDNKEIVIITDDAEKISNQILDYVNDLDKLYELSRNGQQKFQRLFSIDFQMQERLKVIKEILKAKTLD